MTSDVKTRLLEFLQKGNYVAFFELAEKHLPVDDGSTVHMFNELRMEYIHGTKDFSFNGRLQTLVYRCFQDSPSKAPAHTPNSRMEETETPKLAWWKNVYVQIIVALITASTSLLLGWRTFFPVAETNQKKTIIGTLVDNQGKIVKDALEIHLNTGGGKLKGDVYPNGDFKLHNVVVRKEDVSIELEIRKNGASQSIKIPPITLKPEQEKDNIINLKDVPIN